MRLVRFIDWVQTPMEQRGVIADILRLYVAADVVLPGGGRGWTEEECGVAVGPTPTKTPRRRKIDEVNPASPSSRAPKRSKRATSPPFLPMTLFVRNEGESHAQAIARFKKDHPDFVSSPASSLVANTNRYAYSCTITD